MQLDSFALTIAGRRSTNEDAICARPELGLFVVADGLGGYDGGEVASAIAVETICARVAAATADAEADLVHATRLAGERISARREGDLAQMGSTIAMVRFANGRAVIAHIGDSRVYRLRDGDLAQLTVDHSLVSQMIASGLTPDAAFPWRHVITRALGISPPEPDIQTEPVRAGDVYLVCSDGLYEALSARAIGALLDASPEDACRTLVEAALAAGSRDNISAIVVRAC